MANFNGANYSKILKGHLPKWCDLVLHLVSKASCVPGSNIMLMLNSLASLQFGHSKGLLDSCSQIYKLRSIQLLLQYFEDDRAEAVEADKEAIG